MTLPKTMYPGMVNSPETTITNNINESDTIIYVLDPARVPEPPNLMTLGTGTNAETVKVLEMNDNAITVERGFQGIPKAWPAGTVIARNFTEYDYNALKENIEDLEATKETPQGAQEKADAALNSAKQYTDQEVGEVAQALTTHLADFMQEDVILNIPSDYATLQAAVDSVSKKYKAVDVKVKINIESGHRPASGIIVENGDYSFITITSEDDIVTVDPSFTGDFIKGIGANMPVLGTLIDMNDKGLDGYHASLNSRGVILANCGIRNAGGRGLYVTGNSHVEATSSEVTGCNNRNVWITRGSSLSAESANFSANKGGDDAFYCSRASFANIMYANLSNAYQNGIAVIRSTVACEGANVSGAGAVGLIVQRGSRVSAEKINAENCGASGIIVEGGSTADLREANASGAINTGIEVRSGSRANCYLATADNCGADGIRVVDGSQVNARQASFKNNASRDVRISNGSTITLASATTTNGAPNQIDCVPASFNSINEAGIIFAINTPNGN